MKMLLPAAVATAAVVFVGLSVSAPAAADAAPPPAVAAQLDGISDKVVDKLWNTTDHYWHDGDYNRIVALLRVVSEADPQFVEVYSSAAWLLWSMNDTQAADYFLQRGVIKNPQRWDLYHDLGWHLFNTKRYKDALPYLQKATAFKNAGAIAWKTLGHTYERLGRMDDALKAWQVVVKRYPTDIAGPPNLKRVQARARSG